MRRTRLDDSSCPIARCVSQVGDWWSILILRNASMGQTRFDDFQRGIGIAPNILTRRLRTLVEAGLLERIRYQDHPPRHEYRLTGKGRDFLSVLIAMADWGNRWLMPAGAFRIRSTETGELVEPVLIDRNTGRPITAEGIKVELAPAAPDRAPGPETGPGRED
ncbi:winged helix-turn-helix transcriptional regulator [Azospirillum thermophilum]|uniref:Transcriptional regulator n=1 Tax=Azospirillum thermophilum TaxID=2202148 RepID=A0A2S2CP67_9PROT|nr:helix-turn-helix domain-containing protein [Azospirillum thermophilum]AWK86117.1 transcriptional regulator [Azospirillum thermophilum]